MGMGLHPTTAQIATPRPPLSPILGLRTSWGWGLSPSQAQRRYPFKGLSHTQGFTHALCPSAQTHRVQG